MKTKKKHIDSNRQFITLEVCERCGGTGKIQHPYFTAYQNAKRDGIDVKKPTAPDHIECPSCGGDGSTKISERYGDFLDRIIDQVAVALEDHFMGQVAAMTSQLIAESIDDFRERMDSLEVRCSNLSSDIQAIDIK